MSVQHTFQSVGLNRHTCSMRQQMGICCHGSDACRVSPNTDFVAQQGPGGPDLFELLHKGIIGRIRQCWPLARVYCV